MAARYGAVDRDGWEPPTCNGGFDTLTLSHSNREPLIDTEAGF